MEHARQELVIWVQDHHDASVIVILTEDAEDKSKGHSV